MTAHLLTELTVFILAVFVGFEVISKVPTMLHTPLMSATNAIHGIVLVGAILIAGTADAPLGAIVGFILVAARIVERVRRLHRDRTHARDVPAEDASAEAARGRCAMTVADTALANPVDIAYLVTGDLFILGLRYLSSPKTARLGNRISAVGMLIAVVATLTQGHRELDRRSARRCSSARSSASSRRSA